MEDEMNSPAVPPPLGPPTRYTVRLGLEPGNRSVTMRIVTSLGELKAAAAAALTQVRHEPESGFSTVEILQAETEFTPDPENDLLDYWGLEL
jgi:hypothetical protein